MSLSLWYCLLSLSLSLSLSLCVCVLRVCGVHFSKELQATANKEVLAKLLQGCSCLVLSAFDSICTGKQIIDRRDGVDFWAGPPLMEIGECKIYGDVIVISDDGTHFVIGEVIDGKSHCVYQMNIPIGNASGRAKYGHLIASVDGASPDQHILWYAQSLQQQNKRISTNQAYPISATVVSVVGSDSVPEKRRQAAMQLSIQKTVQDLVPKTKSKKPKPPSPDPQSFGALDSAGTVVSPLPPAEQSIPEPAATPKAARGSSARAKPETTPRRTSSRKLEQSPPEVPAGDDTDGPPGSKKPRVAKDEAPGTKTRKLCQSSPGINKKRRDDQSADNLDYDEVATMLRNALNEQSAVNEANNKLSTKQMTALFQHQLDMAQKQTNKTTQALIDQVKALTQHLSNPVVSSPTSTPQHATPLRSLSAPAMKPAHAPNQPTEQPMRILAQMMPAQHPNPMQPPDQTHPAEPPPHMTAQPSTWHAPPSPYAAHSLTQYHAMHSQQREEEAWEVANALRRQMYQEQNQAWEAASALRRQLHQEQSRAFMSKYM